jgi:MFS family permease
MMGRRFLIAAFAGGMSFATISVAIPLELSALGAHPGLVGAVLAAGTGSVAAGAACAGAAASVLGGRRTLALALAISGIGTLVLGATGSTPGVTTAAVLVGLGIGLFWVASHLVLGQRAGNAGSEVGFLTHYAAYTLGAVIGSACTGLIVAGATHSGFAACTGVRLAAMLGTAATICGLVAWLPLAERGTAPARRTRLGPATHLAVQVPDLLLVAGWALLLPLAPVVLSEGYGLGPLAIGVVMSALSVAKIGGTFVARALSRRRGPRRTTVVMLAGAAALCLSLCIAGGASVFVAVLLATTVATAGAWPLVVDAAQARVPPERRQGLSVVWNAREYVVVAAATFVAGRVLGAFSSAAPLFVLAAILIAAAALVAAAVTRRPVWRGGPQGAAQ